MNVKRTKQTIKKIRDEICNLYIVDNEIFTQDELKQLDKIALFFTNINIRLGGIIKWKNIVISAKVNKT